MLGKLPRLFAKADMDCSEVRKSSSEYLDGSLAPSRLQRFRAHLAGCQPCQSFINSLTSVVGMLTGLSRVQPPPTLKQSILQRIRQPERNG